MEEGAQCRGKERCGGRSEARHQDGGGRRSQTKASGRHVGSRLERGGPRSVQVMGVHFERELSTFGWAYRLWLKTVVSPDFEWRNSDARWFRGLAAGAACAAGPGEQRRTGSPPAQTKNCRTEGAPIFPSLHATRIPDNGEPLLTDRRTRLVGMGSSSTAAAAWPTQRVRATQLMLAAAVPFRLFLDLTRLQRASGHLKSSLPFPALRADHCTHTPQTKFQEDYPPVILEYRRCLSLKVLPTPGVFLKGEGTHPF